MTDATRREVVHDAKSDAGTETVLSVRNLSIAFTNGCSSITVVNSVSFDVRRGETLGLVGESGSGKSVTALSIMRLLPRSRARIVAGEIIFQGNDLVTMPIAELRRLRGKDLAMIFQDPLTALNPIVTIGSQLALAIKVHDRRITKRAVRARVCDLLRKVGVPDADSCFHRYPHEYSGGMRQRVVIAMAMANRPSLIIADEPTTALDVTVQAQVLEALDVARQETGAATILITHDLGVVAERADRVAVMYGGRLVEQATVFQAFAAPRHPYTLALLSTVIREGSADQDIVTIPGQPANAANLPSGCAFHPRCALAGAACRVEVPPLVEVAEDHRTACLFHEKVPSLMQRGAESPPARIHTGGP